MRTSLGQLVRVLIGLGAVPDRELSRFEHSMQVCPKCSQRKMVVLSKVQFCPHCDHTERLPTLT